MNYKIGSEIRVSSSHSRPSIMCDDNQLSFKQLDDGSEVGNDQSNELIRLGSKISAEIPLN